MPNAPGANNGTLSTNRANHSKISKLSTKEFKHYKINPLILNLT